MALYIYRRLRAFGLGPLRAGEYACRAHGGLVAEPRARSISIALGPDGGKRVVIERDVPLPSMAPSSAKIEFDIATIRRWLAQSSEGTAAEPA